MTKYFGKVVGDDEFKIRGIEARQRSMPPFIEEIQRSCVESVLAPLGWDQSEIRRELAETRVPELTAFTSSMRD